MRLTLAITTYDRPDALNAILATVGRQTAAADEVVVADDGSSEATREVIARFASAVAYPVLHVRQPHDGFRLTRLRNLAIARSRGEYIVFVDGDMLLHAAFLADHRRHARPGNWVQGVRVHLDAHATAAALARPGTLPRVTSPGLGGLRRLYALRAPVIAPVLRRAANAFVAIKGCNQGYWRRDLLAVNGFNEDIVGWGPEDKELAARLRHHGIRRCTLILGAVAYHLHHAPASRDRGAVNEAVLARTRTQRLVRCAHGLDGHL